MNWSVFICLFVLALEQADRSFDRKIEKILKLIKRRFNLRNEYNPVLEEPRNPEDLPEAEPIHPGHTLLRPSLDMLRSAVKFPQKDSTRNAVYGNLDNLGITYDKTPYRVRYSNFRKRNDVMNAILDAVDKTKESEKRPQLVIIKPELTPEKPNYRTLKVLTSHGQMISEEENNNANEILDPDSDEGVSEENGDVYRRKHHRTKEELKQAMESYRDDPSLLRTNNKKKKRSRFRDRSNESSGLFRNCSSGSGSSSSSSDSDSNYERNEGNPYTVHKDKYKQNWLWNHFLDGDHMNINPYGPQFNTLGPSGADLFFGRKWWYFNQDDYKPFR